MNYATPRHLFALFVCVAMFGLSACDSGGDDDPSVAGQWSGTTSIGGAALGIDATFNEADGDITGNGVIDVAGETFSADVSGTYNYPSVSLSLETQEFADLNFSGDIADSGNRIDGELNGSGFSGEEITLTRD